jgi:diacylglycerol kinase (ATP)
VSAQPICLICNPAAGGGRAERLARGVASALGPSCELQLTERPGHAAGLAREALSTGRYRRIAVAGGDGTLHEVVQGLLERSPQTPAPVLAYLGGGSSCDFAKALPRRTPLERAESGRARQVDLIRCSCSGSQPRYAVNASSVGLLADATAAYEQRKRPVALARAIALDLGMVAAGLTAIARHARAEATVSVNDGELLRVSFANLMISKSPWIGGGMRLGVPIDPAGGEALFSVLAAASRPQLARTIPALYRGAIAGHPSFSSRRCRALTIDTETPLRVEADGELVGWTPVRYEVLPRALTIAE